MNNTLYILTSSDSIGDSLSSINQNYLILDNLLTNIQLSATNYWIPVANYYEQRKDYWKTASRKIKDSFPLWQIAATNFESNSARWITPVVTWYPCIVDIDIVNNNPDQFRQLLKNWADYIHPIFTRSSPIPNYVEGQMLIVYCFSYDQDVPTEQTYSLSDSTTCVTNDSTVCAYCSRCYYGGRGPCGINCSGCTHCNNCGTQSCYFYPNQPHTKTKRSTIAADLEIKYSNKYESVIINAAVFKIEQCRWAFQSFLTER